MFMITYYKPFSWMAVGFKRSDGYWRLRVGRLHVARMNNKRASQMLIRELSSKLIKPVVSNCDESHRQK